MIGKPNILVLFALCLGLGACVTTSPPSKDVHLTWDNAFVRIPGIMPVAKEFRDAYIAQETQGLTFPTVIYMHGSGGLSPSAYGDLDVLKKAGMAVIALDSFARTRPINPDGDLSNQCGAPCGGTQDKIAAMRKAELTHALERVRQLSWVDQNNLFGWGHSEGVYAMGAYPGAIFKGRILTGNDCYRGFGAQEPTLVVMARGDPYQKGKFVGCQNKSGFNDTMTYVEIPGDVHNAAQTLIGEKAVIEFLHRHMTSSWLPPPFHKAGDGESGQEVEKLIVGKSLTLNVMRGDNAGRTQLVYYDPNGAVVKTTNKPNTFDYGQYEINNDGSHCYIWESKAKKPCWQIIKKGTRFYLIKNESLYLAEITFENGDPRGLLATGAEAKTKAIAP